MNIHRVHKNLITLFILKLIFSLSINKRVAVTTGARFKSLQDCRLYWLRVFLLFVSVRINVIFGP